MYIFYHSSSTMCHVKKTEDKNAGDYKNASSKYNLPCYSDAEDVLEYCMFNCLEAYAFSSVGVFQCL